MHAQPRVEGEGEDVLQPTDRHKPLERLHEPVAGFVCTVCLFRTRSRDESQKHSRSSGAGHPNHHVGGWGDLRSRRGCHHRDEAAVPIHVIGPPGAT